MTIANGLNVFDFINYANLLQQSFKTGNYLLPLQAFGSYGGGSGGLSRNFLFVLLSYPFAYVFSHIAKINIELVLNIFSTIATSLSAVFVYKIGRLFFENKKAIFSTLIYIATPFIFFVGTNATTYSLLLSTSAIWFYFLFKGIQKKDEKHGIVSSFAFVANTFVSLSGATLIVAHLYGLFKIKKKMTWFVMNLAILAVVFASLYYFTFINKAYPTTFNGLKILFMASLFLWEAVNGLSIVFFVFIIAAFFMLMVRIFKRKFDYFDAIFTLSFIMLLSSLTVFHFIPLVNFTSVIVLLPILFMRTFYGNKYFKFIFVAILIFAFIKITPIVYQFHDFPHPHYAYSLWINQVAQDGIVLAGHECPWLQFYTNLTIVCRGRDLTTLDYQNKKLFVTEEYFANENQMEFEYVASSFHLPFTNVVEQELGKPDVIVNKTIAKIADYPYQVRPIEDPYQWLYSVYPHFYQSAIINLEFLKPRYAIYHVQ